MSAVAVRRLEAGDLDRVCAAMPSHPRGVYERELRLQEVGGTEMLVAWLDGEPVGFVVLVLDDEAETPGESRGFAVVGELFVEPPHRRHGVARALMAALEERARAAAKPGVLLETGTGEGFAAARALYRSLGYLEQGGVYLGGWSDPDRPGVHVVDALTRWLKRFGDAIIP